MATKFQALTTYTVGSGGTTAFDFTSIPGTYTDLLIYLSMRTDQTGYVDPNIKFNNTNTNKTGLYIRGSGAGNGGGGEYPYSVGATNGSNQTAGIFTTSTIYIPNYANTSYNKMYLIDTVSEDNATLAYDTLLGGLWASTAAITQVTIAYTNFVQYSTATLYVISKS